MSIENFVSRNAKKHFQKLCHQPLENFTSSHKPTNQDQMKTFNKAISHCYKPHKCWENVNNPHTYTSVEILKLVTSPFVLHLRNWGGSHFQEIIWGEWYTLEMGNKVSKISICQIGPGLTQIWGDHSLLYYEEASLTVFNKLI